MHETVRSVGVPFCNLDLNGVRSFQSMRFVLLREVLLCGSALHLFSVVTSSRTHDITPLISRSSPMATARLPHGAQRPIRPRTAFLDAR